MPLRSSSRRPVRAVLLALIAGGLCLAAGCGKKEEKVVGTPHHEHHAPHKGTLVVFGEEFGHLELVLDPATGQLTGYVLDGEAENAVRIVQKEIKLKIDLSGSGAATAAIPGAVATTQPGAPMPALLAVKLAAQPNALVGEAVGDTSVFSATVPELKGVSRFNGMVEAITIKMQPFNNVGFGFPGGNEVPEPAPSRP